jgi:hypothetical protein
VRGAAGTVAETCQLVIASTLWFRRRRGRAVRLTRRSRKDEATGRIAYPEELHGRRASDLDRRRRARSRRAGGRTSTSGFFRALVVSDPRWVDSPTHRPSLLLFVFFFANRFTLATFPARHEVESMPIAYCAREHAFQRHAWLRRGGGQRARWQPAQREEWSGEEIRRAPSPVWWQMSTDLRRSNGATETQPSVARELGQRHEPWSEASLSSSILNEARDRRLPFHARAQEAPGSVSSLRRNAKGDTR